MRILLSSLSAVFVEDLLADKARHHLERIATLIVPR